MSETNNICRSVILSFDGRKSLDENLDENNFNKRCKYISFVRHCNITLIALNIKVKYICHLLDLSFLSISQVKISIINNSLIYIVHCDTYKHLHDIMYIIFN